MIIAFVIGLVLLAIPAVLVMGTLIECVWDMIQERRTGHFRQMCEREAALELAREHQLPWPEVQP